MNTKYLPATGLCLACIWLPCNKEKPKKYAYWTINGQEYSSNNVKASIGKDIAFLSGHDNNRFGISFRTVRLPKAKAMKKNNDSGNKPTPDYL